MSACATCDGALFKGKELAVVGGGDTAMEEATFLTRFAHQGDVIHRREEFRASRIMLERARRNPKIELVTNAVVDEILGELPRPGVTGVRLRDTRDGSTREVPIGGVFVAIGHEPNTELFRGMLDMDAAGYLKVQAGLDGDQHPGRVRRAATSPTTSTGRRSPRPAPAAWPPSTPSASWAIMAHHERAASSPKAGPTTTSSPSSS